MAEIDEPDGATRPDGKSSSPAAASGGREATACGEDRLPDVLRSFVAGVCSPCGGGEGELLLRRLQAASCSHVPRLREASRNSARDLLEWTRRGSALRSLLVISVGSITLIALTGLLIFMFFLVAATANTIVISILTSLAAAGGFLTMFFACLAAIYIGTLSVALFVISVMTISTIIAITIATGWVGFFWVVWSVARKGLDLTKQSISMTSSAI